MKLLREVEEVRIDPEKVAKIKEENDGKLILTCQLQKANTVNANGRYYPKRLLEREMEKYHKIIKSRNAMGELDHPDSANISLQKVSHVITEAEWEGDAIMGKIELLNTPFGKIASSLVEQGVLIGVSSRAVGSTKRNNNGYDEVLEDLQLICWDIISNPSTPGSWIMTESIDIDEQTTSALKSYNKAYEYVKAQRDRMSKYGI